MVREVERAALRDEVTSEAPALDAPARDVARADDDVRAFVERAEEVGQVADVAGQVRVHLEETLVAFGETLLERLDVRGAEAELARPVRHADVGILGGDGVGEVACPVGRGVVHDHEVGRRRGAADGLDELRQVVLLVVTGGDNECLWYDSAILLAAFRPRRGAPNAPRRNRYPRRAQRASMFGRRGFRFTISGWP